MANKSPYERIDNFNPAVKCDNPIQEKWIHKQVVKIVGDTEDDFVLEEKAVCIDKLNIQKSIQEEAKVTDLKYLLSQLLLQNGKDYKITGDEPELNQKQGFYGDITSVQNLVEGKGKLINPEQIKATLGEEFAELSTDQLATMSDDDILGYIKQYREAHESKSDVPENLNVDKEGGAQ